MGWPVNYKRVERLYQEARLQVRRRKRKEVAIGELQPLFRPTAANQAWSMDFASDRTVEGRVLKCLTIVDDATHEAVAIDVERAVSGVGVTRVLDRLALSRGLTEVVRSDNGKEFCGKDMVMWAHDNGPAPVTIHLTADRRWRPIEILGYPPKCMPGDQTPRNMLPIARRQRRR